MNNKYILNKSFSVKYDLKSLLFCYDYFNHGLVLPKKIDRTITRKIIHFLAKFFIIIAYYLRVYGLFFPVRRINDDAIIIFTGIGEWSNSVKLIQEKGHYKILKKTKDKNAYERERKFYEKYRDNTTHIKFPNFSFKENNTIEIEFLKGTSFQRQIRDGSLSFDESIRHYKKIKDNLEKLYHKKSTLIHGDLCPENIYIRNDYYYLIDFTDSHIDTIHFDLYTLLERIVFTYPFGINNKQSFHRFHYKKESLLDLLDIKPKDLASTEENILHYKMKRFPERFRKSPTL